jgi:hypothetical protein
MLPLHAGWLGVQASVLQLVVAASQYWLDEQDEYTELESPLVLQVRTALS